ncbi:hypothetical protein GCM10009745_48460 [Kribbella yunnanensis]|uniref:Response regulatory domain-containing protein n=1 Tax=Kribbella yunnanensis TaxID=190194 RepID=A0ABN2I0R8_9ACTN
MLVVEDDSTLAELLARLLELKFDVVGIASRGNDVLPMVRRHRPDVITMDLGLTDADGTDLTTIITREHPSSRVVMATARSGRRDLMRGLAAGAVGFLTKPFSGDEFLATVEEAARGGFPIAAQTHLSAEEIIETQELIVEKINLRNAIENR